MVYPLLKRLHNQTSMQRWRRLESSSISGQASGLHTLPSQSSHNLGACSSQFNHLSPPSSVSRSFYGKGKGSQWLVRSVGYTEPTQTRKAEVVNHRLMRLSRLEGSTAGGDLSGGHRVAQVLRPPTRGWGRGTRCGNQETPYTIGPGTSVVFLRLTQELEEVQNQRNLQLLTSKSCLLWAHHSEGCGGLAAKVVGPSGSLIHYAGLSPLLCSASQCVSLAFTDWWNHVSLNDCRMEENLCIDSWQPQSVIKIQEQLLKA